MRWPAIDVQTPFAVGRDARAVSSGTRQAPYRVARYSGPGEPILDRSPARGAMNRARPNSCGNRSDSPPDGNQITPPARKPRTTIHGSQTRAVHDGLRLLHRHRNRPQRRALGASPTAPEEASGGPPSLHRAAAGSAPGKPTSNPVRSPRPRPRPDDPPEQSPLRGNPNGNSSRLPAADAGP